MKITNIRSFMTYKNFFSNENITIKTAINLINKNGKKCLVICDKKKKLKGILSDGDIRKSILKGSQIYDKIKNIYNKKPITIYEEKISYKKLLNLFKVNFIDAIPVIDEKKIIKKIFTWDDILKNNFTNKIKQKKIPHTEIVILSGGIGERLKPFTNILPKALIPIDGISIIEQIILNFNKYGINNFNIIINYKSQIIKSFLKESVNFKKNKITFIQEKKPLGTAGGLSILKKSMKSDFILTNCDILIKYDISKIYKYHQLNKNDLTIITFKKINVLPYGNCLIDESNNLIKIEEKPYTKFLINTGMYIMNPSIFNFLKTNQKININILIEKLIKFKKKVKTYQIDEEDWFDVGEWPQYYKTVESYN